MLDILNTNSIYSIFPKDNLDFQSVYEKLRYKKLCECCFQEFRDLYLEWYLKSFGRDPETEGKADFPDYSFHDFCIHLKKY